MLPSPAACRTLTSQLHVPSFTEGSIDPALVELVVVAMHGNFMLCLGFSIAARVRKRAVFSPALSPARELRYFVPPMWPPKVQGPFWLDVLSLRRDGVLSIRNGFVPEYCLAFCTEDSACTLEGWRCPFKCPFKQHRTLL